MYRRQGGIRKLAGLFRAPKPGRQGAMSVSSRLGLMRQLCLSEPRSPEVTGALLQ